MGLRANLDALETTKSSCTRWQSNYFSSFIQPAALSFHRLRHHGSRHFLYLSSIRSYEDIRAKILRGFSVLPIEIHLTIDVHQWPKFSLTGGLS